jgi:hypothetical protein
MTYWHPQNLAKFEGEKYVLKKKSQLMDPLVLLKEENNLPCNMNDMPLGVISH